ncbi:MAG: hypothetical protein HY744_08600 [Deltaproteobacteria bacterium]|nr:hypothetical protein [Deltaproteobacteria bacterium]
MVAELHRVRQVMFEESGGDIARYLELVRAAAARASAARRGRAASRQPATNG